MIYEYAVEPKVVVEWGKDRKLYCYFRDKFGVGTIRIMSEYPIYNEWRKQLFKAYNSVIDDMERQRITALIGLLTEIMITRNNSNYDSNSSWLVNAEEEDKRCPFQAILSCQNPNNNQKILSGQISNIDSDLKWSLKSQFSFKRTANEMAKIISSMLRKCNIAVFIDPYFRANQRSFREPLIAFLTEISQKCNNSNSVSLELHVSADIYNAPSFEFFRDECVKNMPNCIPKDLKILFKRWKRRNNGPDLHDRYILTDIGGITSTRGLDSDDSGSETNFILLEKQVYIHLWNDYVNDPAFDLDGTEFEIIGRRR
ncbi:MAG: hypothetical protein BWK80_19025 [Desulfobacteraceae bacterium IS3]|nr:MAG: hypothetical protein BWK80_19025 [Desulfobacteraceae bacterium IS3]